MMKKILLTSALLAGVMSPAFATPTPTLAGPLPTSAGTGLAASYYKFTSTPVDTLTNANTLVAAAPRPTATFTALTVCFPSCSNTETDGNTLSSYISSNGKNLMGSSTLGDAVTIFQGFIAIRSPGNKTFMLTSDDGSELVIGGATIINDNNDHSLGGSSATVDFTQAGLYSFFVEDFEDGGVTGVTVLENVLGGTPIAIATADLYLPSAVPEPASMALLGAGVFGLGMIRRRRA